MKTGLEYFYNAMTEGTPEERSSAIAGLKALNPLEKKIWHAYKASRELENDILNIDEPIEDVGAFLIAMTSLGAREFSFTAKGSQAMENIYDFMMHGCDIKNGTTETTLMQEDALIIRIWF